MLGYSEVYYFLIVINNILVMDNTRHIKFPTSKLLLTTTEISLIILFKKRTIQVRWLIDVMVLGEFGEFKGHAGNKARCE